ncbi:hypothetical protein B0H67DRAFT_107144 [Lasiosphaeris hirsuta]|uniref:C2H2-type domain-containing protein n=1 Tax=Lasiosphaeris hirsuta TaxID=260670 RepID=A0AA40AYV5_9PEZI|nr:hypothetical protein B0H67DRAFT_107144 [Lasiosphaeris hirsuta]
MAGSPQDEQGNIPIDPNLELSDMYTNPPAFPGPVVGYGDPESQHTLAPTVTHFPQNWDPTLFAPPPARMGSTFPHFEGDNLQSPKDEEPPQDNDSGQSSPEIGGNGDNASRNDAGELVCGFVDSQTSTPCERSFKRGCDLRKHMKNHLRPTMCEFCSKGFAENKDLKRHVRAHHGDEVGGRGADFRCPACSYTTNRDDNLKRHRDTKGHWGTS